MLNKGPTGARGKDGVPGLPGRSGAKGEEGSSGVSGRDGDKGSRGDNGLDGQPGPTGSAVSKLHLFLTPLLSTTSFSISLFAF